MKEMLMAMFWGMAAVMLPALLVCHFCGNLHWWPIYFASVFSATLGFIAGRIIDKVF
jgi:hypothetical protein